MQPLLDRVGRGWYFTLMAFISGVLGGLATWIVKTKGMRWRKERQQSEANYKATDSIKQELKGIGNEHQEVIAIEQDR